MAKVGETLTAKVTPTGATVNYQWQASADDGTTWDDIADATSKTYILSENEVGKLIRVKVTGTGNFTGTKTSDPVGPVTVALKEVTRADGDVTQDAGKTGGTELSYNFVAEGKKLTIDANNTKLPYYEADGSTPPRTANWVGVAIPIPEGVNTEEVTATINGKECVDLFFAEGKYMEYIDVKDGDLTDNAATYTWVIKWGSGYADETITVKLINVAGLEAPEEEPEPANLVATGSYGIHDNKVYAGYELQDKNGAQIPLVESNIESMSVKDPDGNVTDLTVVGETDPYLWFNIAKEAGTYTYTVVTKGEESKTYKATLTWTAPTEAKVSFQAPESAKDVFTEATDEAPAQVDFSKVTADKLLDWTSVKDGYYAIELKIESVDLREENVKYAFRVYGDGTAIEPEIKGDLDCQYVTTDWELGTATMYYVLADGSLYQAKINVVSLTPADEPAPEVSGSIERDPGNTGGDLQYNIENDTVTFTSGEIKWYPEDKDLGRAAGNRVGVQINAPADFDTTGVTVKIGEQTYNWNDIEDGDGYFWWYPLVTKAGETFTATVVWNESSTQEFKVVIGEGVTLEPAPDTTDPELVVVSPEAGDIQLGYGETFKLEVTASDENLYELEVDHSFEGTLPEFSVYASESDPYGGQGEAFAEAGVTVTYNADAQKWTIDFGPTVTQQIVAKGGITFYLVLVDDAGNKWGSMDPTTPENTFAYNVTQDEAPEVSTYKFSYEVPGGIVAGEEVEVDVTFATVEEGDYGYEGVRFKFAAQGPGDVTFKAVDSNEVEHTFTNEGYWGPDGGFDIPAEYTATTDWTLVFSKAGDYTITFSLVDLDAGEALVTETVEITAIEYVPMAVSSEVPTFKVGKWQEYTVSTVANDDAGRMVRAYFELPEKATVEYYEVKDGNWYPLGNEYGPAEGFPVADATSKFRAVFSEAGTYTVTVEFKEVGTDEVLATYEMEVTVNEKPHVPMEVSAEVEPFTVGEQQEFVVKTTANDDAGRMVRAHFTIPDAATVEYQEQQEGHPDFGEWFQLDDVFGPATGFPVADVDDSAFRATFDTAGDYTITIKFVEVGTDEVLATYEMEVTVVDPSEAAKAAFLEAATNYNPESEVYGYSFNGTDLTIDFDFAGLNEGEIAAAVMGAAEDFLDAVFDQNNGNASKVVINMNNQEITLTEDDYNTGNSILELASAVFGLTDGDELIEAVTKFVVADGDDGVAIADFTMTVTNQDDVTFTLDDLKATFNNVTKTD